MIDRGHAVQSAKPARAALAAILVTAPAPLREQLRHLPPARRARACAALTCPENTDRQTPALHQTLNPLRQRTPPPARTPPAPETQNTRNVEDTTPRPTPPPPSLA